MDETFELVGKLLGDLLVEDREPSLEEKRLLVKVAMTALFDLHSMASSLGRIATALEKESLI